MLGATTRTSGKGANPRARSLPMSLSNSSSEDSVLSCDSRTIPWPRRAAQARGPFWAKWCDKSGSLPVGGPWPERAGTMLAVAADPITEALDHRTGLPSPELADLSVVRDRFPALARTVDGRPCVFADAPGGTQVPRSVIEATVAYLERHNANVGGAFVTSVESDEVIDEARDLGRCAPRLRRGRGGVRAET